MNLEMKVLSIIPREEFFERWHLSEEENPKSDQNSLDRLTKFESRQGDISWVEINDLEVVSKIVLPHHDASNHWFRTSLGGTTISDFLRKYDYLNIGSPPSHDCCLERIDFQMKHFMKRLKSGSSYYEGFFMYVTQEPDRDLGQMSKRGGHIYAGSFHQFASYAFLTQIGSFKPIRLFMCDFSLD